MIGFDNIENHTVAMDHFLLKWRFTEEKYSVLSVFDLKQLKPLDEEASFFLNNFITESNLHEEVPFTKDFFKTEDWIGFKEDGEAEIKKWLIKKGLPFDKKVYLSWQDDIGMIAPWELVVKYFDDFYYGSSDDLTVFDESLNWAVLFFHEDIVYFGTNAEYKVD
jgi:hypothetical protein